MHLIVLHSSSFVNCIKWKIIIKRNLNRKVCGITLNLIVWNIFYQFVKYVLAVYTLVWKWFVFSQMSKSWLIQGLLIKSSLVSDLNTGISISYYIPSSLIVDVFHTKYAFIIHRKWNIKYTQKPGKRSPHINHKMLCRYTEVFLRGPS